MITIDWAAICQQYDITSDELKAIAADLYLPQEKLNIMQTKQLLQRVRMLYGATLEEWPEESL